MNTINTRAGTWPRLSSTLRLTLILLALLVGVASMGAQSEPQTSPEVQADQEPQQNREGASVDEAPKNPSAAGTKAPTQTASTPVDPSLLRLTSGNDLAVIPVEGFIRPFTLDSLQHRVERAKKAGADVIVLQINTPGGLAKAALDISTYLKNLQLPTIAWVDTQAYSAGSLIAAACDHIVMAHSSQMGDTAPIIPGQNLKPTERAKALSPLLADFRESAQLNGYDFAPFHAMCVLGVEVYQIRNPKTGEVRLVNQVDYAFMVQGKDITSGLLNQLQNTAKQVIGGGSQAAGVAKPSMEIAEEEDKGQWKLIKRVHDGQTLLTLSQTEATDIGINKAVVRNVGELESDLQASNVQMVYQSWVVSLAGVLSNFWVRGLLIFVLLVALFAELVTGTGIAAAVALVAGLALVGAPMLIGLAEWWHLILFLVGVGLILVEIFIIPGFGVAGISGLLCMMVGLVLMVVPTGGVLPMNNQNVTDAVQQSILATLLSFIAAGVAIYFLMRHYDTVPGLNRLILSDSAPAGGAWVKQSRGSQDEPTGYSQAEDQDQAEQALVGATGTVVSELRPVGRAEIDGQIVDVVSVAGFIKPGQRIRVLSVRGNKIDVEPDEYVDETPGEDASRKAGPITFEKDPDAGDWG